MEVGVLGPTQVSDGMGVRDAGTPKQRSLLAALALNLGRTVTTDRLIDLVWGDAAPGAVQATLHAYVSGLRRCLEPDRPRGSPPTVLITATGGYTLLLDPDRLDAARFSRVVAAEHRAHAGPTWPAAPGSDPAELARSIAALEEVLGLWRGEAYAELGDADDARAERARLDELRVVAQEDRAVAYLRLGQHATVAAELEALTVTHPLRERLWGLRALALARGGRQADALEVLAQLRSRLDDELGLEPGAELRTLQVAILRQDPALVRTGTPGRRPSSPAAPLPDAPWVAPPREPLLGRDAELRVLTDQLDRLDRGRSAFACLVGEPGIGKTRLAEALVDEAGARGIRVVTGRGSQDDGAPPLWPWAQVLRELGAELATPPAGASDFAVWREVVDAVLAAADERPVLLVLDDLHWADPASLRALRLLVTDAGSAPLMLLLTWRSHPAPAGALADVVEALARQHCVRLALAGLTADGATALVQRVTGRRPADEAAAALWSRTEGNPFFLVEYARLAAERGLDRLLAETDPPAAVQDVLVRRLDRLPAESRTLLQTAAVVGRHLELSVLAAAADRDEDATLDGLEPAVSAGLLAEDGVDRFVFAHALVRDTAYATQSPSRRARLHARVAEALERHPGRETEVARHWSAAGPARAGRAWRSGVAAAAVARRLHAHEQSAELLQGALDSLADDPEAAARERYELLLQLADACRWVGQWQRLLAAVEAAIAVARELGDLELLARAATSTAAGAVWLSAAYGTVQTTVVAALRESLDGLPSSDLALRARVMLCLATELYYGATFAEREALVDEGLAMAARLGDEHVLLDSLLLACSALWRRSTVVRRLDHARAAVELAGRLGAQQAEVLASTYAALACAELGLVDQMWAEVERAQDQAQRLQLPYSLIVLDTLALSWLAMAGRFAEAEEVLARIVRLNGQIALHVANRAVEGAVIALRLWQGRLGELVPALAALDDGMLPVRGAVVSMLLRAGRRDDAEAHFRVGPIAPDGDDWMATHLWCAAAEAAVAFGDRPLAARAYAWLAPYAGQATLAGSGNALGPVDAFLALAARAVGERAAATQHADQALVLMEQWRIPLAAQWLCDQRAAYDF